MFPSHSFNDYDTVGDGTGRKERLTEENETVVGTGKKLKTQPTQLMILRIFYNILYQCYAVNGKMIRRLLNPLNNSQAKIIRYLGIP